MDRLPGFALLGVLVLAAACGAERAEDSPIVGGTAMAVPAVAVTSTVVEPTLVAPSPTSAPSPPLTAIPDQSAALTAAFGLRTRFPAATALIEEAPARTGVAVLTPDGARHVGGDDGTFVLASVVKLPVMIATLERARLEERALTAQEQNLLELMITVSSNNATDVLWNSLGGGAGVAALLEPLGVTSIEFAVDDQWGDSRASALEIALLLELFVAEDTVLSDEVRTAAMELMESVVADQRWGASAGVDLGSGPTVTLAIKNGWYPELSGWLINSAGVITVTDGAAAASETHVLVILTEGAATQTEGVRAIEEIAAAINHELVPEALSVAIDPPAVIASPPPADGGPEEKPAEGAEGASQPEPDPAAPATALVAFARSSDVLVPADASLVGSEGTTSELTLWYELPADAAEAMLRSYAASMTPFGWLQVAGPPSIVLAKSDERRWVGLSAYPAVAGSRLIEVTIAPAPGVVPASAGAP